MDQNPTPNQNQNSWQPGLPVEPQSWPAQTGPPAPYQQFAAPAPTQQPQPQVYGPSGPYQPAGGTYQQAPAQPYPQPAHQVNVPLAPYQPPFMRPTSQPDYGGMPQATFPAASHRLRNVMLGLLGLLVILGGAGAYIFSRTPTSGNITPQQLFNTSLSNDLSTKTLTQTTTQGTNAVVTKFDLADTHKPKISATATISFGSQTVGKVVGYGTLTNTYGELVQAPDVPAASLNTWIQIRKDGVLPKDANPLDTLYPNYDPNYSLLGDMIFGNLSSTDRTTLVNYIVQNNVYKYDPTQVMKATVDGQATYKYVVTLQHLDTLNQKAAKIFGITDKTAIAAVTAQGAVGKATMYIAVSSGRLVKVTTDDATVLYGSYDKTTLPAEPKAAIQYDAWAAVSGTASTVSTQSPPSSGGNTQSPAVADANRKIDLESIQDSLEGYFASTGNYPTLAEMNDSTWLSVNMPDLDPSALKDPAGTTAAIAGTPTKNQYAYQVGSDSSLDSCESDETSCQYYLLTATLSDGTRFSLKDAADS